MQNIQYSSPTQRGLFLIRENNKPSNYTDNKSSIENKKLDRIPVKHKKNNGIVLQSRYFFDFIEFIQRFKWC